MIAKLLHQLVFRASAALKVVCRLGVFRSVLRVRSEDL